MKRAIKGNVMTQRRIDLLERFEKAVRAHELIGSLDPDDWDDVEEEYTKAKGSLSNSIANLEARCRKGKS